MNILYEYQIANMDVGTVNGISDAVMAIHYRVIAKCDGVDMQPVYSGVVQLDEPGSDFIKFSDLTKDQVERWLKSSIDVDGIEAALAEQVASLVKTQPAVQPQTSKLPPWMASQ